MCLASNTHKSVNVASRITIEFILSFRLPLRKNVISRRFLSCCERGLYSGWRYDCRRGSSVGLQYGGAGAPLQACAQGLLARPRLRRGDAQADCAEAARRARGRQLARPARRGSGRRRVRPVGGCVLRRRDGGARAPCLAPEPPVADPVTTTAGRQVDGASKRASKKKKGKRKRDAWCARRARGRPHAPPSASRPAAPRRRSAPQSQIKSLQEVIDEVCCHPPPPAAEWPPPPASRPVRRPPRPPRRPSARGPPPPRSQAQYHKYPSWAPTYLSVAAAPSRYPPRRFCSVRTPRAPPPPPPPPPLAARRRSPCPRLATSALPVCHQRLAARDDRARGGVTLASTRSLRRCRASPQSTSAPSRATTWARSTPSPHTARRGSRGWYESDECEKL